MTKLPGLAPRVAPKQVQQEQPKAPISSPAAQQAGKLSEDELGKRTGLGTEQAVVGQFAQDPQADQVAKRSGVLNFLSTQGAASEPVWQPGGEPQALAYEGQSFVRNEYMNHVHGRPDDKKVAEQLNNLTYAINSGQLSPEEELDTLAARSKLLMTAAAFEPRGLEPMKGQILSDDGKSMEQVDPNAMQRRGLADFDRMTQLVEQNGEELADWTTVHQAIDGLAADGVLTDPELKKFEQLENANMAARGSGESVDYYMSGLGNQIKIPQGSPEETRAGVEAAVQFKKELNEIDALGHTDPAAAGQRLEGLYQELNKELIGLEQDQAAGRSNPRGLVAAQMLDELCHGSRWSGIEAAMREVGSADRVLGEGDKALRDRTALAIVQGSEPRHLALYSTQAERLMRPSGYSDRDAPHAAMAGQKLMDGFAQAETFPPVWHVNALADVARSCPSETMQKVYPEFEKKVRAQLKSQPHLASKYLEALEHNFTAGGFRDLTSVQPGILNSIARLRDDLLAMQEQQD